jgi:hypothetical protein
MTMHQGEDTSSISFKGAAPRFPSEDNERLLSENIKILPKLRGYNNYSHQIAFEMEETQLKNFI